MQHQLVPRCVLWQFSEIPSYWLSHVSIRRSLAFLSAEKHYLANKWHLRLLDVFEPLGVLNSTYMVRGVKYFCTDLFQSIQKKSRGFSPLDSTGFYNFSLPTLFDKAQKKRTRTPSSKRPKTPTEYRSRGFGTQWGHRDSNPRPSD